MICVRRWIIRFFVAHPAVLVRLLSPEATRAPQIQGRLVAYFLTQVIMTFRLSALRRARLFFTIPALQRHLREMTCGIRYSFLSPLITPFE